MIGPVVGVTGPVVSVTGPLAVDVLACSPDNDCLYLCVLSCQQSSQHTGVDSPVAPEDSCPDVSSCLYVCSSLHIHWGNQVDIQDIH